MLTTKITEAEKRTATIQALEADIFRLSEEQDKLHNHPDKDMLERLERCLQISEAALFDLVGAEEYQKLTGQRL